MYLDLLGKIDVDFLSFTHLFKGRWKEEEFLNW